MITQEINKHKRRSYANSHVGMSTRYSRHRAQAKYRGEHYELKPEEYSMLWASVGITDRHQLTGRRADSWAMVRVDPSKPWRVDNIQMMTRSAYRKSYRHRYAELGYFNNT